MRHVDTRCRGSQYFRTCPSSLPDPRRVGQFVLVVGPACDLVLLQKPAAAGNGFDQGRGCSFRLDTDDQIVDQVLPLALRHRAVDAFVGKDHGPVFEECEEDQDPGPITGREDLLLEEGGLGAKVDGAVEMVFRNQTAADTASSPATRKPTPAPTTVGRVIHHTPSRPRSRRKRWRARRRAPRRGHPGWRPAIGPYRDRRPARRCRGRSRPPVRDSAGGGRFPDRLEVSLGEDGADLHQSVSSGLLVRTRPQAVRRRRASIRSSPSRRTPGNRR